MRISPSQVHTFDLCNRKWAFKVIEGIPEPQSKAQEEGLAGHARIEALVTKGDHPGEDKLGRLIQAAMRPGHLPPPGAAVLAEHEFSIPLGGGHSFYGFIDCVVPPADGRVVVIDYKFTSNLYWAKTVADLRTDPQAVGYGKAALEHFPEAREIERRWLYLQKGTTHVRPVSFIGSAVEVEEAWLPLAAKARDMLTLRVRKVPALEIAPAPLDDQGIRQACGSFGGCPYRERCPDSPAAHGKFGFGVRKILPFSANGARDGAQQQAHNAQLGETQHMALSLMAQLTQLKGAPAASTSAPAPAPAQAAPAPAQASPAPAPAPAPAAQAAPPAQAAPAGRSALAAIQAAKGARGVNPPEASSAPAPAPAPAPAQATLPAPEILPAQATLPALDSTVTHLSPEQAATIDPAAAAATAPANSMAEAIKKPRKAKGPPASQPAGEIRSQLTVLFNAAVVKRPSDNADPIQLVEILAPIMRDVADRSEKAHWLLIPYNEGKALLAHAFDKWLEESNWKGTIYVDARSQESMAVREVLRARADIIVEGTAT